MTVALTLIAIIAFTFLCAMSFLIVAHLPLSVHRGAARQGRFAHLGHRADYSQVQPSA